MLLGIVRARELERRSLSWRELLGSGGAADYTRGSFVRRRPQTGAASRATVRIIDS